MHKLVLLVAFSFIFPFIIYAIQFLLVKMTENLRGHPNNLGI